MRSARSRKRAEGAARLIATRDAVEKMNMLEDHNRG